MRRTDYRDAIRRTGILTALAAYDPHVAGTPSLGLQLPTSDIDILCHAPDPDRFTFTVWTLFRSRPYFHMWQWMGANRPVVAPFVAHGWRFELFRSATPVTGQAAWRHFAVEPRLLALGGLGLARTVMALRRSGLKTEPALATALNLRGDPYRALLGIDHLDDEMLSQLIVKTHE